MNKYKKNLITLCEALEIVNVEEFIEQPPETIRNMGEYITENCKWYQEQFEQILEDHPHIMISQALKQQDKDENNESDSSGGNENLGREDI